MPLNGNKNLSPLLKQEKNALIKQYEREVILAKREEDIKKEKLSLLKENKMFNKKKLPMLKENKIFNKKKL